VLWVVFFAGILLLGLATHLSTLSANALPFAEARLLEPQGRIPLAPLANLSLALDRLVGATSDNPRPSHGINLFLHLLNALLVALCLYSFTGKRGLACIFALLFSLHPLSVEPVALASGRAFLLVTTFCLGCTISLLRMEQGRRARWYAASCACYLLALLSGPAAIPFSLFAVALVLRRKNRSRFRSVLTAAPFLAAAAAWVVVLVLPSESVREILQRGAFTQPTPHLLVGSHSLIQALLHMVWPLSNAVVYPLPQPLAWSNTVYWASAASLALLFLAVVLALRWTDLPLLAGALFLLLMLPAWAETTPLEQVRLDSYAYTASWGLCLALAAGLAPLWKRGASAVLPSFFQVMLTAGTVYAGAFLAVRTQAYAREWNTTAEYYQFLSRTYPTSVAVKKAYAAFLRSQGKTADAIPALMEALGMNQKDLETRNLLAEALLAQGRYREALPYLEEVAGTAGQDPRTLRNLGTAHAAAGDFEKSLETFTRLEDLDSDNADALMGKANAFRNLTRPTEATRYYRRALEVDPSNARAHQFLAFICGTSGQRDEAIQHYREAIRLEPRNLEVINNLAILLNRENQREEAIELLEQALTINPRHVPSLYALGYTLESGLKFREALPYYRAVLSIVPDHRNAQIRLDMCQKKLETAERQATETAEPDLSPPLAAEEAPLVAPADVEE